MSRITVYYDEKCLLHDPPYEILSGRVTEWFESPERVKCIKKHLEKFPEEFPITTKHNDYGVDPILEIHEKGYLDYLQTIYEEWVREGGNPEAGVVPEMMLHKNLLPPAFVPNMKHSIGKVGMYHFDLSSTVTSDTWTSAYAAVQTALTATQAALELTPAYLPTSTNGISSGTLATFALIRPPGHHATTNLCGGYCYLNNVVIAASHALIPNPNLKCVIIDVDFHHGNGVEEILQRKKGMKSGTNEWAERCQYISLHAHPDYPYYTTHLPTPLAKDVTSEEYLTKLNTNLEDVKNWCGEETLVLVSLGLDTLAGDPIGGFAGLTCQEDYFKIGDEIGKFVRDRHAKCCFLLEGGYVVERLGECVEGVFRGYIHGVLNN